MKKLKIGIITHNFPASNSDRQNAGIFVYDFAKALNKKAEVVVFSPGLKDEVKNIGPIKSYFFKFTEKLGSLKIYNPDHLIKFGSFFIKSRKALNKFLSENPDLDFIISMWAFPSGFFAYETFNTRKIPYAIYCLGSDIYIYAKKPILKNLIKKYLINTQIIIADSPDLSMQVQELSGKKTLFLPSASNFPISGMQNKLNSKKIVLTFLGRLEKVKGVDIFINALKNLKESLAKFEINIIGSGSLEGLIKKQIDSLQKEVKIKFWGNLDNSKEIAAILNSSHWLVIPSRSDSIPLVFSESMKLSLPVIASDLPDLKYLINKYKVGILFKQNSPESLTKVLKSLLKKKNYYQTFKKNTLKAAKIFDLNKTSDKLINLITKNEK